MGYRDNAFHDDKKRKHGFLYVALGLLTALVLGAIWFLLTH